MNMIIVGGGFAGCSAASVAARHGCHVTLLERTDMLLGTGLVGGIFRNNGRFTAAEEMIALGAGALFHILDTNCRHKDLYFPGHAHASLYDIAKVPPAIYEYLTSLGVSIQLKHRVNKLTLSNGHIECVCTDQKETFEGDVFVDTTGTCGPMSACNSYGNGCAMCVMRCPSFGPRCSLTKLAGLDEISGLRANGKPGSFSGACKLMKESLSNSLLNRLNKDGVLVIPIPKALQENHLNEKCCQQYAETSYLENLVVLDTGHAKLMTPFYPLEKLHQIPGFEMARYEDPYAAGLGNSIRFTACAKCADTMQVDSIENLFCAGEKSGLFVGHTEAICTGALAGYNACRYLNHQPLLTLSRSLAVGELIAFTHEQMATLEGLYKKYSFSGSVFFERMKQLGLYSTDPADIQNRVKKTGLYGVFD